MKRLMSVIALLLVGSFSGNSSVFGESIIFDVVNKALKKEVTYSIIIQQRYLIP
ncbi:hypothetical protein ACQKCU_21175 [Heyndrickxia sporothermodurans]